MSSDAAQQAKEIFDRELDQATEEIVKRWEKVYKKTKSKKVDLLAILRKKPDAKPS